MALEVALAWSVRQSGLARRNRDLDALALKCNRRSAAARGTETKFAMLIELQREIRAFCDARARRHRA